MVGAQKGFAVGKGLILVTDDGRTWTPRYSGGATFVSIDAVDAAHAWAVGDKALYGTVDGGKHWTGLGSPENAVLHAVHFVDEHFGWGVGGGRLFRSGDSGRTWGELRPPCGAEAVCFTGQDDGWVAAGNRIAHSTTGGDSWTTVLTVPGQEDVNGWYPQSLQCTRPGVVWALFTGGNAATSHSPYVVYRGTATGQWTAVAKEAMTGPREVRAPSLGTSPAPISALGPDSAVLLTYTGPLDVPVGLEVADEAGHRLGPRRDIPGLVSPTAASFVSPDVGWVVGTKMAAEADAILVTTDGGRTWQEQFVRQAPVR